MGLEQVIADVRRDGEKRAEAVLEQARREAQEMLDAARRKAGEYASARDAQAERDAAQLRAQMESHAASTARKVVLEAEAELRGELRGRLHEGFAGLPADVRSDHLKRLLKRAKEQIAKGKVWGAEQDAKVLKAQRTYTHAGSLPVAGGIVVESEDGSERLDLSYETLLDDLWRDILRVEADLFR